MSMPISRRHEAALDLLHKAGVGSYTAAPPLFRLLWRLGVDIPPPHFIGFGWLALLLGAVFFAFMMLFSAIFTARFSAMIGSNLVAGMLFGVLMAGYFAYSRRRLGLPAWRDLPSA